MAGHPGEDAVTAFLYLVILRLGEVIPAHYAYLMGFGGRLGRSGRFQESRQQGFGVFVLTVHLPFAAHQVRKLAAVGHIQRLGGEFLRAPGIFAHGEHAAAQLHAGGGEPGIQVYHPGEFVQVQGLNIYMSGVSYHWATVALKMSSTSFSMMVSQRVPSTASRDMVASKSS